MQEEPKWTDHDVDEALEESFPASDPPSYMNDGSYVNKPAPVRESKRKESGRSAGTTARPEKDDA